MKLSQLVEDRRTVTIPIGSGELTLGYNPAGLTPQMFTLADEARQDQDNITRMATFLVQMLESLLLDWDVTDDDDTPLPITVETLAQVPVPILMKIFEIMMEEMAVPKASSATSGSGSSPAASQEALPSGISSFARVGT